MIGSGPFLRGMRTWLEGQRGEQRVVVWRIRAEVFTQSGGMQWMRDAVGLLMCGAVRRQDFDELGVDGKALWLGWSVAPGTSDGDIAKVLRWIPSHASMSDFNPTGELCLSDLSDTPLRKASSQGDGCCMPFCGFCFDNGPYLQ